MKFMNSTTCRLKQRMQYKEYAVLKKLESDEEQVFRY
jgi:hypothetical protein